MTDTARPSCPWIPSAVLMLALPSAALPAPTLVEPSGDVYLSRPTLVWQVVPGASTYIAQVLNTSGTAVTSVQQGAGSLCSGSTCSWTVNVNLSAGSYTWRAFSYTSSWVGPSPAMPFTVHAPPPPPQIAPTGDVCESRPTLSWTAEPSATSYIAIIRNQAGGAVSSVQAAASSLCSGPTCSWTPTVDLAVGSYTWVSESYNTAGWGPYSPAMPFTVHAPAPPSQIAPTGDVYESRPTLTWTTEPSATSYIAIIRNQAGAPVGSVQAAASNLCSDMTCSWTPSVDLAAGSYTWVSESYNSVGWGPYGPAMPFTVHAPPPPAQITPSGDVYESRPTVSWTAEPSATYYIAIIRDQSGSPVNSVQAAAVSLCSGATCSWTPNADLAAGSYTWVSESYTSVGWGPYSPEMAFTVLAPPAPELVSPRGSVVAAPEFVWEAVSIATTYIAQVLGPSGAPVTSVHESAGTLCSGSTCTWAPNPLPPGEYTWRAMSYTPAGWGPFGESVPFEVLGSCADLGGDFNGDGRSDRACSSDGATYVILSGEDGFAQPAPWLAQPLAKPVTGDFNADGLTDVGTFDGATGIFSIATSDGSAFAPPTPWGTATGTEGGSSYTCDGATTRVGSADFDGDGIPDVYCKDPASPRVFVGLSDGAGAFSFSIFGSALCDTAEQIGTLELDGDGRADWFCVGNGNGVFLAFPSDGSGFRPSVTGPGASFCGAADYVLGDLNGDGRTDLACKTNGKVALATGVGFLQQGEYGAFCVGGTHAFAADLDGDGDAELVCNAAGAPADDITARRWSGTGLGAAEAWLGDWCSGAVSTGDFNGDARTDLMCDDLRVVVSGTPGVKPDAMVAVSNGLGGETRVDYVASSAFPHTNNPPVKYVVASVTLDDGRGGVSTSTFSYADGYVDRELNQFMGFGFVRETLPCLDGEAACPYVDHWFSQEEGSAGAVTQVQRRDGAGALLSARQSVYTTSSGYPKTVELSAAWSYAFDGHGAGCTAWPCATGVRSYTSFEYDGFGNLTRVTSYGDYDATGDETTTEYSYAPNTTDFIVGSPTRVVVLQGAGGTGMKLAETQIHHDGATQWSQPPSAGLVTTERRWLDTDGSYVETTRSYDGAGNPTAVEDPTGRSVVTTYDTSYDLFPVSVTNGTGESTTTEWDPLCAVPETYTDPNGQTTTHISDVFCRSVEVQGPGGSYERRFYLDLGSPTLQRIRVETPAPASTTGTGALFQETFFDGLGRTYRTVAKGPTPRQQVLVEGSFNARGLVASETVPYYADATPYATSYVYDGLDRVVSAQHSDGTSVDATYGLLTRTVTDERGRPNTTEFDVFGRATVQERTYQGQPVRTTSRYDPLGRLVGLVDDVGNIWSWTFDSLGRTLQKDDPDAGVWSYEYDAAGRMVAQVDAKAQRIEFGYDLAGRRTTKTVLGTPSEVTTTTYGEVRPGYYNAGRATTITSPASVLKLDYDVAGRVVHRTRTIDGVDYVMEHQYDAAGFLLGTTYPDGDAFATTASPFVYDAAGRLTAVPGVLQEIRYDASGRPTRLSNLNGTTTMRTYSPQRGFLERILTTSPTGPIQDLTYGRDESGLVTTVTSPFANESWSYQYDDLDRLVTATNASTPTASQTFAYDTIGRITYNSMAGTYVYPAAGSPRPHAPSAIAGITYGYDGNGNMVSDGQRGLTWDRENRLSLATVSGSSVSFTYGEDWTRLKKTDGTSVSLYPFANYEITDGIATKYLPVSDLGNVAKRTLGATFWIHGDAQGSIQAVTDAAGALVLRRSYRPYGNTLQETGGHQESRGYIGERLDGETGLSYFNARYYDSRLGIFLSSDPSGPPGGLNAFGYGFGNPVNLSDRSGLWPNPNDGGIDPWQIYRIYRIARSVVAVARWIGGLFGGNGDPTTPSSQGAPPPWEDLDFSGGFGQRQLDRIQAVQGRGATGPTVPGTRVDVVVEVGDNPPPHPTPPGSGGGDGSGGRNTGTGADTSADGSGRDSAGGSSSGTTVYSCSHSSTQFVPLFGVGDSEVKCTGPCVAGWQRVYQQGSGQVGAGLGLPFSAGRRSFTIEIADEAKDPFFALGWEFSSGFQLGSRERIDDLSTNFTSLGYGRWHETAFESSWGYTFGLMFMVTIPKSPISSERECRAN